MSAAGRVLMDDDQVRRTIARMAHEIVERHADPRAVTLVGIHRRGVPLAARLARDIAEFAGTAPDMGTLDIALYRDDVGTGVPVLGETDVPFDVSARPVILVDDVLYTGRTTRAAIDAVMDYGRPRAIELAVLVDRGHRELPIQADYVGIRVETSRRERVEVRVDPVDELAAVVEVLGPAENTPAPGG